MKTGLSASEKAIAFFCFLTLALLAFFLFWFVPYLQEKFFMEPKGQPPRFTERQRKAAVIQSNDQALLSQRIMINFAVDSSTIAGPDYQKLDLVLETAEKFPNTIIQIEGNADDTGTAQYNKKLSLQRAKAVSSYLVYKGVEPSRLVVIGNGKDKPLQDNSTEEGRAANRRTEIFYKEVREEENT